nr:MAG TPA: hypothetical protein [Caudoviricetes sp.]
MVICRNIRLSEDCQIVASIVVYSSCLCFGEQNGVKIVKKFSTLFDFSWQGLVGYSRK